MHPIFLCFDRCRGLPPLKNCFFCGELTQSVSPFFLPVIFLDLSVFLLIRLSLFYPLRRYRLKAAFLTSFSASIFLLLSLMLSDVIFSRFSDPLICPRLSGRKPSEQIRTLLCGAPERFLKAPSFYCKMVSACQHLRHLFSHKVVWPCVLRIFKHPV